MRVSEWVIMLVRDRVILCMQAYIYIKCVFVLVHLFEYVMCVIERQMYVYMYVCVYACM